MDQERGMVHLSLMAITVAILAAHFRNNAVKPKPPFVCSSSQGIEKNVVSSYSSYS